jgi:hypothetical protein
MRSILWPAFVAILLALAGSLFWSEGKTETRLADAHRQLATLQYASAATATDAVGGAPALGRVGALGRDPAGDARHVRVTAEYWDAEYASLTPQRDSVGTVVEADPQVLMTDANASFRAAQTETDRSAALRKLDAVVKNYADVLKANPGDADVAYNYEYAVRMRDSYQRARVAAKAAPPAPAAAEPGELPAGPTLHGHPGGPPPKSDMSQFKIVIPKRGEERKDDPQAGKGGAKIRKG